MKDSNSINKHQYFVRFHNYSEVFGFDFTDTTDIDKVIQKSETELVERSGLKYITKLQTPFTGWYAQFRKSGLIRSVEQYSRGVKCGTSVNWLDYDNELHLRSVYTFKDNIANGPCLITDEESDSIAEGAMLNGKRDGKWIIGEKKCEYKNGKLHGDYSWGEDAWGQISKVADPIFQVFSCIKNLNYEPMLIYEAGKYENNQKTGKWSFHLESSNGTFSVDGHYVKNVPSGYWGLSENKNMSDEYIIKEEGKLNNGRKTGTWIINPDSDDPIFNRY